MSRVALALGLSLLLVVIAGFAWTSTATSPGDLAQAPDGSTSCEMWKCGDCSGTGSVSCGWCGGDGIRKGAQCTFCNGRGTIKCVKCGGSGK